MMMEKIKKELQLQLVIKLEKVETNDEEQK